MVVEETCFLDDSKMSTNLIHQLKQMSRSTAGTASYVRRNDKYKCLACGRNYVHQSSFIRHRNMECGQEPRFQCPYCPKKSKRKSNIAAHVRCKHATLIGEVVQEQPSSHTETSDTIDWKAADLISLGLSIRDTAD